MEASELGGRQMRTIDAAFKTRETAREDGGNDMWIEGYFAVFDDVYNMGGGLTESIDAHAFDNTLSGDVRVLTNHDTTLVLGRTGAHTAELSVDAHGLFGRVKINPKDQDAVNTYERVKRGDVTQCSFGFDVLSEDTDIEENGDIHWTLKEVKLYEVSVCTFPAYETTEVTARCADAKTIRAKRFEGWKAAMRKNHAWLTGNEEGEENDG